MGGADWGHPAGNIYKSPKWRSALARRGYEDLLKTRPGSPTILYAEWDLPAFVEEEQDVNEEVSA